MRTHKMREIIEPAIIFINRKAGRSSTYVKTRIDVARYEMDYTQHETIMIMKYLIQL